MRICSPEQLLCVNMHSCVVHDLVVEMLVLGGGGQRAINKKIGCLQMVRFLSEFLYGIPSVPQNAIRAVNVCDRARYDGSVQKTPVEHAQTAFSFVFLRFIASRCLHLAEVARVDSAVDNRDLIGLSCAVVAHRERILRLRRHRCKEVKRVRLRCWTEVVGEQASLFRVRRLLTCDFFYDVGSHPSRAHSSSAKTTYVVHTAYIRSPFHTHLAPVTLSSHPHLQPFISDLLLCSSYIICIISPCPSPTACLISAFRIGHFFCFSDRPRPLALALLLAITPFS